jgi:hypothetical protein
MQITDEMVEKAAKALCEARLWAGASAWALANEVEKENLIFEARAALEAVAPLIAKAENEAIAHMADDFCWAADVDWWLHATKKDVSAETCHQLARAIRARHARHATPTPSTPQEK